MAQCCSFSFVRTFAAQWCCSLILLFDVASPFCSQSRSACFWSRVLALWSLILFLHQAHSQYLLLLLALLSSSFPLLSSSFLFLLLAFLWFLLPSESLTVPISVSLWTVSQYPFSCGLNVSFPLPFCLFVSFALHLCTVQAKLLT